MLELTRSSDASIEDDDVIKLRDEALNPVISAFAVLSAASRLLEESDKLIDDVLLVLMLALTELSELSMLEDDVDIELELALIAASAASTLLEEFDRLKLDT